MRPQRPAYENPTNFSVMRQKPMWETCAVDVRVWLPAAVAAEVEEVQREDPEMLSQMLVYALARRTMFHHLATRRGDAAGAVPGQ
jgi:hypothetical protein